jgi:hypothetical protein
MSLYKESSLPSPEQPSEQKPNVSMPDVNMAINLDNTIAVKENRLKTRVMSPKDREALEKDIARLKRANKARKGFIEKGTE